MSNKTLAISIICILLAAGAIVAVAKLRNKGESQETSMNTTQQQTQNSNQQETPANQVQTPKAEQSTQNTCQRDFDQNKLQTAKVDIAGRQAEIDIKDFGKVTVEFYDKDAPKTVENFLRLANAGYFDCLTFHRVAKGFVIQGGDPTGTGSGGDSAFGGPFADELNPNTPSYKEGYKKGVLAMANAGPNTNTSQFFIMLGDVPLPNNYTIFGKVVSGQEVVDKVGQVDIIPQMGPTDGKPVTPVVMQKVTIVK